MKQDNSSILRVILPVFFLSGAAGGIYEVIWTKQLLLIFGGTAFAVSTVLTSYMAGLAIGSLYIGRYIDKRPANPIGKFAALELGIGLCGLLLLLALPLVTRLYSLSYSSLLPNFHLRNLLRFALCFVALVVPTILMGGTLPVLSKGLFSGERSFGLSIGSLYAINTFGAMFGAVLVGFFLLPRWGVTSSTIAAASLNGLTAVIAFSMGRRREAGAEPEAGEAQPGPQGASRRKSKERDAARGIAEGACADEAPPGWLLLAVAAAAGFTSMCYQIIFTRLLKLVFSNTVAAFTTILVAFLAGIGIGSLIVSRFSDRIARRALALGLIQIALAAAAIWSMPVVFDSLSILNRANDISRGAGWHGYALSRLAVSLLVLLGVSVLSGASFPLVIKSRKKPRALVGSRVGEVYSANTFAAVVGSFAGGFVIIPALGTYWALVAVLSLNALAGAACIAYSRSIKTGRRYALAAAGILAVALSVAANPRETFLGKLKKPGEPVKVVYSAEGASASIHLLENMETGARRLFTDGILAIDTSYESLQTVRLLGHLPALLCKSPRDALVIGFGMGKTAASIAKHPVERIDCVEIVPEIFKTTRYFEDLSDGVLLDPRVNVVVDDGRSFVFGTKRRYDIISCDPIHPAFGSPALYTREYYLECARKLKTGGVIVQYLPFHQLSFYDFAILLRTFKSVFPNTTVWFASYHGIVVGSKAPFEVSFREVQDRLAVEAVRSDLAQSGIRDVYGLLGRMILGANRVEEIVSGGTQWNTDDRPVLEYAESRYYGADTWIDNVQRAIASMEKGPGRPALPLPPEGGAAAELSKACAARLRAMRGRLLFEKGMQYEALGDFIAQLRLTPGDPETIYFAGEALRTYYVAAANDFLAKGNSDGAVERYREALALGLASPDLFEAAGALGASLAESPRALKSLTGLLDEYPNDSAAQRARSSLNRSRSGD